MIVQPLETAVIRTIEVGVGDFVQAGAVLATLDPTFTESRADRRPGAPRQHDGGGAAARGGDLRAAVSAAVRSRIR